MLVAQKQQFYELRHKAGLVQLKKIQDNNKNIDVRVAALETKTDDSSDERLFAEKNLRAAITMTQSQTEKVMAQDKADLAYDHQGC